MTPQVKSRVFEPFFTTKPVGHGTGLGLAQVYGFVKQSGGDIEIESEIGKGTKVTLFLPLRSGEAAERDDPPPAHDAHLLRNKTILIVDDNAQVVEFIESMLGELGCRTVTAKGADAALSILKDTVEIDGVFSDVVMPGELDGIALLRTIRQTYPHLAVVLATGYSDRFLRDGVPPNCEILAKPFRLNEISSAMARALDACAPRR
jgi:CheY-like chemotaxis protein